MCLVFNPIIVEGYAALFSCTCDSYFMLFGVGVSCHYLYSIISYLYVSCNGSTSVGEERANLSAFVHL